MAPKPVGRYSQDSMDLQREFERAVAGTSRLSEDQQDEVVKAHCHFIRNAATLAEKEYEESRARRRRTGNGQEHPDHSGFEEITLEEVDSVRNPRGQRRRSVSPRPNGSRAGATETAVGRPSTFQASLVAMRDFFLWSIDFFWTKAMEMWNKFRFLARQFISCLTQTIRGTRGAAYVTMA